MRAKILDSPQFFTRAIFNFYFLVFKTRSRGLNLEPVYTGFYFMAAGTDKIWDFYHEILRISVFCSGRGLWLSRDSAGWQFYVLGNPSFSRSSWGRL